MTENAVLENAGQIYAQTRVRLTDVVRSLSVEQVAARVAATPAWSVRELIAHLTGNVACILDGKLDGVATEPWTAAQVAERKDKTVEQILDEWTTRAPQVEAMLATWPRRIAGQVIADLATHEQDIRGSVGRTGARDSSAFGVAREFFSLSLGERIAHAGLPALRFRGASREWTAGEGDPRASVCADEFDLVRAIGGRRSAPQIRAYEWDGDPEPYVEIIAPFAKPSNDIVE